MDLRSFVSESLTQILEGIKAAQSKPGGELVAADGYFTPEGNCCPAAQAASSRL
jgi:hypothetical protein